MERIGCVLASRHEALDHLLEPHAARAFHQHEIARPRVLRHRGGHLGDRGEGADPLRLDARLHRTPLHGAREFSRDVEPGSAWDHSAHLLVEALGIGPELEHVPEHGPALAARLDRAQEEQRLPHRGGIGVVGIVEHEDPLGGKELEAMMLGTERPQRLRRLGARHAEMVPHENRRKRVPDVVPAEDPEVHLGAVGQREPGTPLGGDRRLCRDKIGVPVLQGVALDLDWAVAVQLPQALVVPVQHEEAVVRERLGELALRASHLIHRAQRSQMGGARVRPIE